MKDPRIAIVTDWLTGMRGGEKCLEVFCELFPKATIFTLFHVKGSVSPIIEDMDIRTSFLQGFPGVSRWYRHYLPFYPMAVESLGLSGYDLILSISHCAAKGVRKDAGAVHICYCLTPVRYVWKFFDEYFGDENFLKKFFIKRVAEYIKRWDLRVNRGVDHFIAISSDIKGRIRDYYDKDSDIIYPPVSIPETRIKCAFDINICDEDYYLVVSALVPYKRIDLAVKAFNENGRKLLVVGSGGESGKLRKMAADNIEFAGWVSDEELAAYYSQCRALIFPGEEDFGIVPLEVQMCGRPVIAYARGGALDTVIGLDDGGNGTQRPTGIFFDKQTSDALNDAVKKFEENADVFCSRDMVDNSLKFTRDIFKNKISKYVSSKWRQHVSDAKNHTSGQEI